LTLSFRKGQIPLQIIPIMAAVAVVAIIAFTVFSSLNTEIQNSDTFPNVSKTQSQDLTDSYPGMLDSFVIISFIVLVMSSVVTAFLSKFNVIFGFVTIFLLIGILILPIVVNNVWQDVVSDPAITVVEQFPVTDFIMSYFPLLYVGILVLVGIAYSLGDKVT